MKNFIGTNILWRTIENFDDIQLKIKDKLKTNIQPSCLGLFDQPM